MARRWWFILVAVVLLVGLTSVGPASALPSLTYRDANYYAKVALHRNFKGAFDAGYNQRVRCWKRLGPSARQCPDTSWIVGDLSYHGWVRIWLSRKNKNSPVTWNYAYTIKQTNEFCLAQGGSESECTKTFHVD